MTGGGTSGRLARQRRWADLRAVVVPTVVGLALVLAGCTGPSGPDDGAPPAPPTPTEAVDVRAVLAPLVIDDRPDPRQPYDRGAWPHWDDLDGDGCDARQEALRQASTTPARLGPDGCRVLAGDWVSAYDGVALTDPSELEIDHLVPLADAHASGGWAWTTERRRAFANDPAELWPVSAGSNRQKGASTPDRWRPARREVWCSYAQRWVAVKVAYGLSATTSERDALGQMLDTCGAAVDQPSS